jgi:hypothetical protein
MARYLDKDKILYRKVNNVWIGKRSVYTYDLRALWLEETTEDKVRNWWHGKDADYNELFELNIHPVVELLLEVCDLI